MSDSFNERMGRPIIMICCPFKNVHCTVLGAYSAYLTFFHTVVVIGFQPDQYTVDEGAGSVNFTVLVIDGELDFDVVVEFFTEDGSAQGMHEEQSDWPIFLVA